MENASKALLMAGGILIALLVIGALVLMFSNLQDYQIKTNASNQQTEVANFNNQFEPYNKNNLTLMELKSVYNKIISNNSKYPEYYIDTNIYPNVYDKIKKSFSQIEESDKITKVFKCTSIEYKNPDGRISKMIFANV